MVIHIEPPKYPNWLLPDDPTDGPYYILVSNLPSKTTWQEFRDFIFDSLPQDKKCEVFVHIHNTNRNRGWVRVCRYTQFEYMKKFLADINFKGRPVKVADPGYRMGHSQQPAPSMTAPWGAQAQAHMGHPQQPAPPMTGPWGTQASNLNSPCPQKRKQRLWHKLPGLNRRSTQCPPFPSPTSNLLFSPEWHLEWHPGVTPKCRHSTVLKDCNQQCTTQPLRLRLSGHFSSSSSKCTHSTPECSKLPSSLLQ
ncbi:hypothetical protein B0T21DRAFT_372411 [Apiosordaria backusii]|uniref:RRM domain-containing protein n=1 Tax=Apiosordaria backusii TaxID=314023 RepID=A0AA40E4J6_9PEZI|nr:hypothetical protein B0T21DRAFT_372411 [Apiosordaria backusii]